MAMANAKNAAAAPLKAVTFNFPYAGRNSVIRDYALKPSLAAKDFGFDKLKSEDGTPVIDLIGTGASTAFRADATLYFIVDLAVDEDKTFIGRAADGSVLVETQIEDRTFAGILRRKVLKKTGEVRWTPEFCEVLPEGQNGGVSGVTPVDDQALKLERGASGLMVPIRKVLLDLLLLPVLSEYDPEFEEKMNGLARAYNLEAGLFYVSNAMYYRVDKNTTLPPELKVQVETPKDAHLSDLKKAGYTEVISGKPVVFKKAEGQKKAGKVLTNKEMVGMYSFSSEEDKARLRASAPEMPGWYLMPDVIRKIARDLRDSTSFEIPFRSVLLYGGAGSGKTEGARALASLLGLPYGAVTCSPEMDRNGFINSFVPNTKKGEDVLRTALAGFEEVENNFEEAYRKLFRKDPDEFASPADCYQEIMRRALRMGSKDKDFIFEDSPLISAFRNGGLVEIQEPTILKRPGELTALNGLFDNDPKAAHITLPTGETVYRNPNFVVVFTTNESYEDCRALQQSVLSRCQLKQAMQNPPAKTMADRAAKETGFPDRGALNKMAQTIVLMNEFCRNSDVTDGICGPRELSNWAKLAMLRKKQHLEDEELPDEEPSVIAEEFVIEAAVPTMLEKVSQTLEDRDDAVTEVMKRQYDPGLVDKYYAGGEE